ncbi:ATP-dependent DNA helicase PIF1 [Rhizophagus irregularis DAOM 181602=DAOM 197198]|nr:ATP-dependent DNA helicase PIF1 [Rhizophagus irregularis DAOM 181602=DAOM 197198]
MTISPELKLFISDNIDLLPREIYKRLVERGLDLNIRQKQIHYWWTAIGQHRYKRDEDPFISAQKWLKEDSYHVIFQKNCPNSLGFLTELWNVLKNSQFKIHEIGVDATYNTNNLKFELYVVHAEIDGMGFPLAYLTGLEPEFFISDKDFAQISAARFVWKNIKVQLCLWHIKKAVEARLSSNKKPIQINYNGEAAHKLFSFIDPSFRPNLTKEKIIFCPKELRSIVWEKMNKHLHEHPLIPMANGQFRSSNQIWKEAVKEIYDFCQQHLLSWLWVYLWNEWYSADRWFLWFRAGCSNKLSIMKTNMFVEAHWKVLKRDFLYKFFRPRLDLVVFIIMKQVVPQNERKFNHIFVVKREKVDRRKAFKREWKELSSRVLNNNLYLTDINNCFCGCPSFLTSRFLICKHLIQQKGIVDTLFFDMVYRHHQYLFINTISSQIIDFERSNSHNLQTALIFEVAEDENLQVCKEIYERLINTTEKVLDILKDQQDKGNFKWVKSVEKNFQPIEKMLTEITVYKRRRTMIFNASQL